MPMPLSRNVHQDLRTAWTRANDHLPAFGSVFNGVIEQIGKDLAHPGRVDRRPRRVRVLLSDRDSLLLGHIFVEIDHFIE